MLLGCGVIRASLPLKPEATAGRIPLPAAVSFGVQPPRQTLTPKPTLIVPFSFLLSLYNLYNHNILY